MPRVAVVAGARRGSGVAPWVSRAQRTPLTDAPISLVTPHPRSTSRRWLPRLQLIEAERIIFRPLAHPRTPVLTPIFAPFHMLAKDGGEVVHHYRGEG